MMQVNTKYTTHRTTRGPQHADNVIASSFTLPDRYRNPEIETKHIATSKYPIIQYVSWHEITTVVLSSVSVLLTTADTVLLSIRRNDTNLPKNVPNETQWRIPGTNI